MLHGKKIGIIIPAYNEEKLIITTLKGIPIYVDSVVVVDDNSKDNTVNLVANFLQKDDRVTLLSHENNQGVGGAIITGFKYCISKELDIFAVIAGDNQMDTEYLESLIMPIIKEQVDFTKGNRLGKNYRKGMSDFRYVGNKILSFITKIVSGYWDIQDSQSGYVAFSKFCLETINLDKLAKRYQFENDIMVKANVSNIRMKNVFIPARYADEVSGIKYIRFIIKTSFFLFYSFLWRIWNKYMKKLTLISFLIYFNIVLLIVGISLLFYNIYIIFILSMVLLPVPMLMEAVLYFIGLKKSYKKNVSNIQD